jgi:hypothetical protein
MSENFLTQVCEDIQKETCVEKCFILCRSEQIFTCELAGQISIVNIKSDNVMGALVNKKQPILINDANKDREILNLLRKTFGIQHIENAALIPVIAFGKKQVEQVIVLLNRFKTVKEKKDEEKKVSTKFSNSYLPWANPVFQSLLEHSFSVQSLKREKNAIINTETNILQVVDTILSKKSTLTFVNQIETSL